MFCKWHYLNSQKEPHSKLLVIQFSGPFDLAAYNVNCSTYILFIQSAFEIFNIIQNDVTTHLKGAKNNTSQWKCVL